MLLTIGKYPHSTAHKVKYIMLCFIRHKLMHHCELHLFLVSFLVPLVQYYIKTIKYFSWAHNLFLKRKLASSPIVILSINVLFRVCIVKKDSSKP